MFFSASCGSLPCRVRVTHLSSSSLFLNLSFREKAKKKEVPLQLPLENFISDLGLIMEDNNGSIITKEKIDQVAMWLGSTVSSAFFSSLERFSCVMLSTSDPEGEDDDEYDDAYSTITTTTTTDDDNNNNSNPPIVQVTGQTTTKDVANFPV